MPTLPVSDEDAAVRFTLDAALTDAGFTVVAMDVAQEALGQADMRLTDLAMPGFDGRVLLDVVRAHEPAPPVVLLTCMAPSAAELEGADSKF